MVAKRPDLTREKWEAEEENRARLGWASSRRPALALWRLFAFRCQDCRHDQVLDLNTRELWDLDHTDYGPEGSTE
jgi:hypothetical protein